MSKGKWMVLCGMLTSAVWAGSVLYEDSFDGKQLDAGWGAYLNSPINVSNGCVTLSNGEALSSGHCAFITRSIGTADMATFQGAQAYDFFSHPLTIEVVLGDLTGVPKSGAPRIAYFFGVASAAAADALTPATAESGIFFQIERQDKDDQESYRLVLNEQVGGKSGNQYLGHLSGVPTGLSMTLDRAGWQLNITGAVFSKGPNRGSSEASGIFSKLTAADFAQFNLTMGCVHLGPAVEAGAMQVLDLRILSGAELLEEPVVQAPAVPAEHVKPAILESGFPRAFFFRVAENKAINPAYPYARWEEEFSRLQGFIGKALNEEKINPEIRNPEFFTRFKAAHPDQLVLIHVNGNSRSPLYDTEDFFAGHWLYEEAAEILSDIPAEDGETDIQVSNTEHFQTGIGRFSRDSTDIVLVNKKLDGTHDWQRSEQVKLVAVDQANGTIRVQRGCFGTKPLAFEANTACAAAHVQEGPWMDGAPMLWSYNFSTECPRDSKGRNCADVLAANLGQKFADGGLLAAADGIQFDVAHNSNHGDMNGDGMADDGIFDGINTYGIGTIEFYRKLRAELGEDRLILADGVAKVCQRGFGILNGVESEGWPHHPDINFLGWSGGLNRMMFWSRESAVPVFNYINHKFKDKTESKAYTVNKQLSLPFSHHRLVFAVAQFFDAAVCYALFPDPEPGEGTGIWDELKMGTENKLNWLGFPQGPATHLARGGENLLAGVIPDLTEKEGSLVWEQSIPCSGPDLVVIVRASADPLKGYPETYARLIDAWIDGADPDAVDENPMAWERLAQPMSWVNKTPFESVFYFRGIKTDSVDFTMRIEGADPATIHSVEAYAAPDAMFRLYDNGVVLANPSYELDATFDLKKLFPECSFRRLQASSKQDVEVNNGAPVSGAVTLGPLDGLFLVRTDI